MHKGVAWCDKYAPHCPNTCREGAGTIELANGDRYVGDWHQDQMHGKGKYISAESEYEGQWVQGLRHGKVMYKLGIQCA